MNKHVCALKRAVVIYIVKIMSPYTRFHLKRFIGALWMFSNLIKMHYRN